MLILVMSSYYMGLTDKIFRKVTFSEGQKGSGFLFLQRRRAKTKSDELKSGFVRELGSRLQSKNASFGTLGEWNRGRGKEAM